ncbi:poly-gamma-glutamate hydrolase family protein [Nannocystaceae bacterium ST9]
MPLLVQGCAQADLDDLHEEYEDEEFADPAAAPAGQDIGPPLAASKTLVSVAAAPAGQSFNQDEMACSVPTALAGVMVGDQVRVTRNAGEYALYTVAQRRKSDNPNVVRMGLDARQRVGTSNGFSASLTSPVVASGLTDAQAAAASEFVERLNDDGSNTGLIVIAPHGGVIETNTDLQAEATAAALACSSWICKGWKQGGGGYERWHVTSTKISPRSFPGLGQLVDRGFAYAVAFHGKSSGGVLIGGAAPLELKQLVQAAIQAALSDPDIEVVIASPDDDLSGDSAHNVVNWLTAGGVGGIQIEQSPTVRNSHWQAVANAVIGVYAQLI